MTSSFEPARRAASGDEFQADPWPHGVQVFRPDNGETGTVEPAASAPVLDLESVRREAFAAGKAEGRCELPWAEAETWKGATRALADAAEVLDALRTGYLRDQRELVIDLALAVAEAVLARELVVDRHALVALVERALGGLDGASGGAAGRGAATRVLLAPEHHAALAYAPAGEDAPLARLARIPGIVIEADPELANGESRIERGASRVDLRRAALLARVREELAPLVDVAPEAPPEPEPAPAPISEVAEPQVANVAPTRRAPRKPRTAKPKPTPTPKAEAKQKAEAAPKAETTEKPKAAAKPRATAKPKPKARSAAAPESSDASNEPEESQ